MLISIITKKLLLSTLKAKITAETETKLTAAVIVSVCLTQITITLTVRITVCFTNSAAVNEAAAEKTAKIAKTKKKILS